MENQTMQTPNTKTPKTTLLVTLILIGILPLISISCTDNTEIERPNPPPPSQYSNSLEGTV